jgi:hypothetical protein
LKTLLGLSLADMSIDLRKRYKISNWLEGVVVTDLNGGLPTIAKSLLPGDVVVEVAQETVTSSDDFWIKLVLRPTNKFTYIADLFEDCLAGGGPDERSAVGVIGVDKGFDFGDEVFGADE